MCRSWAPLEIMTLQCCRSTSISKVLNHFPCNPYTSRYLFSSETNFLQRLLESPLLCVYTVANMQMKMHYLSDLFIRMLVFFSHRTDLSRIWDLVKLGFILIPENPSPVILSRKILPRPLEYTKRIISH